jgi:hypothetical protein
MDEGSLAMAAAEALAKVFSGVLGGTVRSVSDQLYGLVSRRFRSLGEGGTFDAYESDVAAPAARDRVIQTLRLQLANDAEFRQQVNTLVSRINASDSSVRSVVSASHGSAAAGRDLTQTTSHSNKRTSYGGIVVAVVAIAVVALVLLIGRRVWTAVDHTIQANRLGGNTTCSQYLASTDSEAKAGVMKQLYLARNKPQQAGDPFIIQNTEYYCGNNPRTTLAQLADAVGSG